jgi:short-subunit dehydrogenase
MLSSVARVEVADAGIAVSTLYPFITATDFVKSLRAGSEAAARMEAPLSSLSQTPEQVAEKVLYLVKSGVERADLVPEKFGGTFKS